MFCIGHFDCRFFVYFPYETAFPESKHLKEYNFTKDHIFQIHYPSIVSLKFNFFDLLQISWVYRGNGNEFHEQHQTMWQKWQNPPQLLLKKEREKREEGGRTCAIHRRKVAGSGQPVVLYMRGSVKPFAQNIAFSTHLVTVWRLRLLAWPFNGRLETLH